MDDMRANFSTMRVFKLTAFVYIRRDVDGGGVVRDESFEVGVYLKIVWKIPVLPSLSVHCLIKLHKRGKKQQFQRGRFVNILYMQILVTVNDKVSMLVFTEMSLLTDKD